MDLTSTTQARVTVSKEADEILQNAINSFRTGLTPEQLAEFNSIQSLPDTNAVLVFTAELDIRRQSQRGKSIASRLFPVLQAVHSFTGVIETFVSSNPIIAALVWGSVKMTMQIILNAASYYEAFAELFMNLGTICPRFEQYQALFPTSTRLQVALCNFNASIIRCCQRVIKMPKISSGWTSPLNPLSPAFWQSFQQSFEPNLQELRDYSKNVKEEIRLAQADSEHRHRELQRVERGEAEKSRRSLSRFIPRTGAQLDAMHHSQLVRNGELERKRNQKLLDSLSSHDYMKPFKQARQKRYPQSARWIFDTKEFRSWAEGKTSPLLWCSGKMGSGKTILAASVIDFLLTDISEYKRNVTFFFSRFDDSESLRAEVILRAVVRQMINIQDVSGHIKVALGIIQSANGEVLSKLTELLGTLLKLKRQPAWIVIDGIDECPRAERHKTIQAFASIVSAYPEVRVFVTSRDHADYMTEEAFPGLRQVSMNCLEARRDMTQLVTQAVQNCLDGEELLVTDEELITDIKKTLTDNADGMILWVTLVLRELCIQSSDEMIRDAISLQNLPKSLAEVFNQALKRIVSNGKENITQAILPWIVAAKQPLSLRQLEECCLIRVLQEYSMKDRYVNGIHLVDSWFQGLIEVDHETKTVHFIHSSVQRFFLKAPVDPDFNSFYVSMEQADRHIGEVIVTYLNFNDFKKTLAKRRRALPPISPGTILQQTLANEFGRRNFLLRGRRTQTAEIDGTIATCTQPSRSTLKETMDMEHPFLSYASNYWLSHSFNFNPRNCQVWHIWQNMLINGHELTTSPVSERPHHTMDEALVHWAIFTRHTPLLYIVATLKDLLCQCYWPFFDYVIEENNPELLSLLFKTNIKDPESSFLFSHCCRAAQHGLVGILKVMIEAGVDVNGNVAKRPLIEAIEAGQVETIELLLASGANPDLARDTGLSPLEICIDNENVQIIKLLLEFGADVNRKSQSVMTPLVRACSSKLRNLDIIELLFKAGAKFYEHDGFKILKKAVKDGNREFVELLVKEDVNVNGSPGNKDATLMLLAAKDGSFVIMDILLDAGALVEDVEDLLSRIPEKLVDCKDYYELSERLHESGG